METGPACKQMVVEITDNKIKPTYVMSGGVSTVDGGFSSSEKAVSKKLYCSQKSHSRIIRYISII